MNHIELSVNQNQIDVYATNAGTTAPLKHIVWGFSFPGSPRPFEGAAAVSWLK
jgi:hypothetical protein